MGFYFYSACCLFIIFSKATTAIDTISPSESLSDGRTLISSDGSFALGFFSPGTSKNRYLGIWYNNIPIQNVVWVANRVNPVNDSTGLLKIETSGKIVLRVQNTTAVWSTNTTASVQNPVLQLLDSRNLVVRDGNDSNPENYYWQSFDYPSDTMLPGMKIGIDLRTGLHRILAAWKSWDDPSPGDLTYGVELEGNPEMVLRKGVEKYYRSGLWNGDGFSGSPNLRSNPIFDYDFAWNETEVYYIYFLKNKSVMSRFVLNQTESVRQRYTWNPETQTWKLFSIMPSDYCDRCGLCGPNGNCDNNKLPACQCLTRFKPKLLERWNSSDWSDGCIHSKPLNCQTGDGFIKIGKVKTPDTTNSWVNKTMNLKECRAKCLRNCYCMAYTNLDVTRGGSGCAMWFGDLDDIKQFESDGQDLYIRVSASEAEQKKRAKVKLGIILGTVIAALLGRNQGVSLTNMELLSPLLEVVKCFGRPTSRYVNDHRKLEENMNDLRRKVNDLNIRKQDLELKKGEEIRCRKVVKSEVENWFEKLSGHLPSNMGLSLPNLEKLYLGLNYLVGPFPMSIPNASQLAILDISSNYISGFSRESLGFSSLEELYVSACNVKGSIPAEIGNLSRLILIEIGDNELTGIIPSTIGRLKDLQRLYLSYNNLEGPVPSELCHLNKLAFLSLTSNKLSGQIPACLGDLVSLRKMFLGSNMFSSSMPSTLTGLTDLLNLNLSSNSLSGPLPFDIGKWKVLISMDLSNNQFSGDIPTGVADLKDLTYFSLSNNRITGSIPKSFGDLLSLQFMDLSRNNLSGEIPESLEKLSYLEYFNVSFNRLQGEIPRGGLFGNYSIESFKGNEALCGAPQLHLPNCKVKPLKNSNAKAKLKIYVSLPIASTILMMALIFIILRRNVKQPTIVPYPFYKLA
ncbi:hypothetical protein V6N11_048214 [Hibiscus sabdariffa]|uniref:Non-specific serine/threonine protein kinase n=2 Tax=Hibiscus sabdariffa TaxID=183260 RepID=A0ABR1ZE39_9ROSI